MNSIQLTSEHKIKLAEMCRALFPEYINLEFNNNNLCFLTQETFDIALEFETSGVNKDYDFKVSDLYLEEYDIEIHWFEFCMTHLTDKVFTNDESYNNFLLSFTNSHPIDYLYTEFQKIK